MTENNVILLLFQTIFLKFLNEFSLFYIKHSDYSFLLFYTQYLDQYILWNTPD